MAEGRAFRFGRARVYGLVVGLGLSFGFVGVVFAIACQSYFMLPKGVLPRDYVTLGTRTPESNLFLPVWTTDYHEFNAAMPEMEWSYANYYAEEGQATDRSGAVHRVEFRRVSGNFLSLLGVAPVYGGTESNASVTAAVITTEMWRDVYGSDRDIVGEPVYAGDGVSVPIVGVADPGFAGVFEHRTDFWVLESESLPAQEVTISAGLYMFGVLPDGLTFAALRSLLADHRFPMAERRDDRAEAVRGLELNPEARRETRERLMWLGTVVALLLALAFVAFVDFLATDHAMRGRAHAIRLAVGATPTDVFRESVAKHGKYGLAIAGVGLASFLYIGNVLLGMDPFAAALGDLRMKYSVIGFGTGIGLLAVAFLGSCWTAARIASRMSLLHDRNVGRSARRARPAWTTLLFAAAASLLLTLSITLHYVEDATSKLGFAHHDTLMVGVLYSDEPRPLRIHDALSANPAVINTARTEMLPMLAETIEPKNRTAVVGHEELVDAGFYRNRVDAAFFDVLGVDLVAGSLLDRGRQREAVMSRAAATLFVPDVRDVLGASVAFARHNRSEQSDVFTVVGVVEDVPYGGLGESPRPLVYTSLTDADAASRFQDFWLIRHQGDADEIVAALHELGGGIDEAYRIATPAELLDEQFAKRSVEAVLAMAGAFAFALALAGVANALARTVADQAKQPLLRACVACRSYATAGVRRARDTCLSVCSVQLCQRPPFGWRGGDNDIGSG